MSLVNQPVTSLPSPVELARAPHAGRAVAPVGVEVRDAVSGAAQPDLVRLLLRVPRPAVLARVGQRDHGHGRLLHRLLLLLLLLLGFRGGTCGLQLGIRILLSSSQIFLFESSKKFDFNSVTGKGLKFIDFVVVVELIHRQTSTKIS